MTVLAHTELKNLILVVQHVGFDVADLDAALQQWQQLYDVDSNTIRRVPATKAEQDSSPVLFAFFTVAGQEIELIQPKADPYLTLMLAMQSGQAGINHVALNLKPTRRPSVEVIDELQEHILPEFSITSG